MAPRGFAVAAAIVVAVTAPACSRMSDGVPTAVGGAQQSTATTTARPASPPAPADPAPGVVSPPRDPPGPGPLCAPVSLPPVRTVAQVADPAAPTATVTVPDGWSMSGGTGDVGAELGGPAGMRAVITITAAGDDAAAAFRRYADDLTADSSITTLSVLPGEMCGMSGQILLGTLSDGARTTQYRDRVVHVPTGGQHYLIAVHVTAPSNTPGFDDAAGLLTGDVEIGLP